MWAYFIVRRNPICLGMDNVGYNYVEVDIRAKFGKLSKFSAISYPCSWQVD